MIYTRFKICLFLITKQNELTFAQIYTFFVKKYKKLITIKIFQKYIKLKKILKLQ
jgi:hypothetical protein